MTKLPRVETTKEALDKFEEFTETLVEHLDELERFAHKLNDLGLNKVALEVMSVRNELDKVHEFLYRLCHGPKE